jgi:hypothetical protein
MRFEVVAYVGEHAGRRALEAIDRLLLIADGEDSTLRSALDGTRIGARCELLRQRLYDLPLRRARILCLIDQDVIEAAVELVEYPRRGIATLQETRGAGDEIVVIERGARAYF